MFLKKSSAFYKNSPIEVTA